MYTKREAIQSVVVEGEDMRKLVANLMELETCTLLVWMALLVLGAEGKEEAEDTVAQIPSSRRQSCNFSSASGRLAGLTAKLVVRPESPGRPPYGGVAVSPTPGVSSQPSCNPSSKGALNMLGRTASGHRSRRREWEVMAVLNGKGLNLVERGMDLANGTVGGGMNTADTAQV
jgi:hypothetical protein